MNLQIRITLLWLLLVFCFLVHGYYHVAELFFGVDIAIPGATGKVPLAAHFFSLLVEILPLIIALATMYVTKKWFLWGSFVFAILLLLLNIVHLVQTVMHEPGEIRQVALLSFIIVVNWLLVRDLNKHRKQFVH